MTAKKTAIEFTIDGQTVRTTAGKTVPVDARDLTVRLAPGAGAQLVLTMKRYANPPRLRFPWDIVRP